jgi:hypothetical protein
MANNFGLFSSLATDKFESLLLDRIRLTSVSGATAEGHSNAAPKYLNVT